MLSLSLGTALTIYPMLLVGPCVLLLSEFNTKNQIKETVTQKLTTAKIYDNEINGRNSSLYSWMDYPLLSLDGRLDISQFCLR